MSKFYNTDPADPDAPRELLEYTSADHGEVSARNLPRALTGGGVNDVSPD